MKIRCLKVEPGMNHEEEFYKIDETDQTWKSVLSEIENLLDCQFLDSGWDGIKLKIELVSLSEEEFAELGES